MNQFNQKHTTLGKLKINLNFTRIFEYCYSANLDEIREKTIP